jgi:sugar/nucleoside kinase (ribokinase family)
LFVTRAEHGGTHYNNGTATHYDTPQVEVVNPTGAGDVFAAALLSSLYVTGNDMNASIRVAARLGALSVTRWWLEGSPTAQEVRAALAEVGYESRN